MAYSCLIDYYLLGHRGARAEMLENSEIGFAYAQSLRPKLHGIEFDIQLTADNQLVVLHDTDLQRLTTSQRKIYQTTLAELQTTLQSDWHKFRDLKNPNFLQQPILTLQNLLPYLTGFKHIELEVKTHKATDYQALAQAIFKVLGDATWQQLPITLTSFDTAFLAVWQNHFQSKLPFKTGLLLEPNATLASEIAFFPTTASQIYVVCNLACRLGCSQIGVYYPLITPELVQIAKRFNLAVTAWTVNEITIAKRLINCGVNTIITDLPTQFCQQLSS